MTKAKAGFLWTFEQREADGTLVSRRQFHNLIPAEGRTYITSAAIKGGAQKTPWYVAVYEADYTPDGTETAATAASTTMECTAYSSTTRPEITFGDVTDGSTSNAAHLVEMTFTTDKTVYGGFVSSSPVKGGTTGTLLSIARSGAEVVKAGRKLTVSVSFNLYSSD